MNPRAEAYERIGAAYEVRVLEPSPPAVAQGPWFADDPVARGEIPAGRQVVSPVCTGDVRWEELVLSEGLLEDELRAGLDDWCAERWLGPYRRLGELPGALVQTRRALHRLAEEAASAREAANGKIGLRYTCGGFGTPFFGDDVQIRVHGAELITDESGEERREPLEVDSDASRFLGDWFGFSASVLEDLRAEADLRAEPSRVQLWPEHFDMALELGSEAGGARAAYGLSPGDERHPEPYAYVAPWTAPPPGELWQASGFAGAELPYAGLLEASDQRAMALQFFRERAAALAM